MADTNQTDAQKAELAARDAEIKAQEMREKTSADARSAEQKKIDAASQKADDARAKAEEAKIDEAGSEEATTASEAKAFSALAEPDRAVGDHHAQKFSQTPENPQLAPGLDPNAEGKIKLTMTTSDSLAAGKETVAYVHPEMVGDYLRAGWSRG